MIFEAYPLLVEQLLHERLIGGALLVCVGRRSGKLALKVSNDSAVAFLEVQERLVAGRGVAGGRGQQAG